jgi:hypothetical protein
VNPHKYTPGNHAPPLLCQLAWCGHPRHRDAIPATAPPCLTLWKHAAMGHRHASHCASYGLLSTAPSSQPAGSGRTRTLYATTLEAAPVRAQNSPRHPNRSEIHQDNRLLHGTVCHASTRSEIVRHACKLPPPWTIKGGAVPRPRGTGRRIAITRTRSAFTTILAPSSISTSGTWRPDLLSCLV